MNTQQQLAFIKSKCIEANPSREWKENICTCMPKRGITIHNNITEYHDDGCDVFKDEIIQLADVLLAIGRKNIPGFYINRFGQMEAKGIDNGGISWNLLLPLDGQEPSTIAFLAELLHG